MAINPYIEWLGISPWDVPIDYYKLLGVSQNERDEQAIEQAFVERQRQVREHLSGSRHEVATRLLGELSAAKNCLVDTNLRRRYDEKIQARQAASDKSGKQQTAAASLTATAKSSPKQQLDSDKPSMTSGSRRRTQLVVGIGSGVVVVLFVSLSVVFFLRRGSIPKSVAALPSNKVPSSEIKNFSDENKPVAVENDPNRKESTEVQQTTEQVASPTPELPTNQDRQDDSKVIEKKVIEPATASPPEANDQQKSSAEVPSEVPSTTGTPSALAAPSSGEEPVQESVKEIETPQNAGTASRFPPLPPFRDAADQQKYIEHLTQLLEHGLTGDESTPVKIERARQHFQAAEALSAKDPRFHYAWGLILLKADQGDEAQRVFQQAIDASPSFLPAWKGILQISVFDGVDAEGLKKILIFARILQRESPQWPDALSRFSSSVYLGRLVEVARIATATSSPVAATVSETDVQIVEMLPKPLGEAYEFGKGKTRKLYSELLAKESPEPEVSPVAQKAAKQIEKLSKETAKIANEKSNLEAESKKNQQLLEQFKKDFEKNKVDLNTKLVACRGKAEFVLRDLQAAEREIALVDIQLSQMAAVDPKGKSRTNPSDIQKQNLLFSRKQNLVNAREGLRQRLNVLVAEGQTLQTTLKQAELDIQSKVAQYDLAQNNLQKKYGGLSDKERTLQNREKRERSKKSKLDTVQGNQTDTPSEAPLVASDVLVQLLELDYEAERAWLLESVQPQAK